MKQALIDSKSAGGDASAIWNAFEKSGAEGLRNIALNGHMRSISSSVCVMKAVLRSGGDWGDVALMCEKERKNTQTHKKRPGPLPALVSSWPLAFAVCPTTLRE